MNEDDTIPPLSLPLPLPLPSSSPLPLPLPSSSPLPPSSPLPDHQKIQKIEKIQKIQKNHKIIDIAQDSSPNAVKYSYFGTKKHFPWYSVTTSLVYVLVCAIWYPNVRRLPQLVLDTGKKVQVWRIYTYSLLHADIMHLVSNLVILLALGTPLEIVHNPVRFFVLHTLGALQAVGGIGWEKRLASKSTSAGVEPWDVPTLVVGASGIAYCMIGVHIPDMVLNWRQMSRVLRWTRLAGVCGLVCAEILLWNFLYQERISYSGHLGGFVGGVLGGFPLVKNVVKARWERWTRGVFSVLYSAYTAAGLINYFVE